MKRFCIGALLLLGLLSVVSFFSRLHINQSDSLPHSIFLTLRDGAIRKGGLVTISNHETKYFGNITYIKRVIGLPGDRIHHDGAHIYCNGKSLGPLQPHTRSGQKLTPLKDLIIPEGYSFVMADHPRSFDSRYQEFGLVPKTHIFGKALVIW